MSARWRIVALAAAVAAVGALGTTIIAALSGMDAAGLTHLLGLLLPAALATLAAALLVRPLLRTATLRQRFGAVASLAVILALANLGALTAAMFVNQHDATLLAALLVYSLGVSVAAALILTDSTAKAVAQLGRTADRLGRGDLDARSGTGTDLSDAGPELAALAGTLDAMAGRLQEAQRRERQGEEIRRDLIAAVSHDLRTPLASLRAMLEAVADEVVVDPPSLRRYAAEMHLQVAQMARLVDDLFEFAQLEAGVIAAETRRVCVRDVVDNALAAVAHGAAEKKLRLVREGGDVDATCSPRMERVLYTLLLNAVQHTPADGTVRLVVTCDDAVVQMEVEDSGDGIASGDLMRVFEPFFRADPARHGPGAGLGLTIARRIVESLGGRISAEPSGAGAKFAVSVPR